jgi:2-polyprenyl-3-methyl-5-hydroxy-6-metoxy-1,4-benzoquinol methylase
MDIKTLDLLVDFILKYMDKSKKISILDVGSCSVNGSFKPMFDNDLWEYTGLDIQAGINVDIVTNDCYTYPIVSNSYDVVVSGNVAEHVEDIYAWSEELVRILKPNGLMYIQSLSEWEYHKYPVDCWRFMPDGFRFLFIKRLGMKEIDIFKNGKYVVMIASKKGG